jgi:hypothetical protein
MPDAARDRKATSAGAPASETDDAQAGGDNPLRARKLQQRAAERRTGVQPDATDASGPAAPDHGGGTAVDLSSPAKVGDFVHGLAAQPPGDQAAAITSLDAGKRASLAANLPPMDDVVRGVVKVVFDHTPDGEIDTLGKLLGARFNLKQVGPDTVKSDGKGIPWESKGLRAAWGVLEALPAAHVQDNKAMWALVRYKVSKGSQAEGVYVDQDDKDKTVDQAAIGYDPATVDQPDKDFSDKDDPMYGTNAFNETIRHEVGHAVDAKLGVSDSYCGKPEGGTWKQYDDGFDAALADMVSASGGAIAGLKDEVRAHVLAALAKVMKSQKFDDIKTPLSAVPGLKDDADQLKAVLADPVVQTLQKNTTAKSPWMSGGGVVMGGRVFEESYDKSWNSYAAEARDRKVSNYQFRAPGEWFAESYAAYYEPVSDPKHKGAKLAGRDPKTKAFFDASVDTAKPDKDKASDDEKKGKKK